jgi:type IV secretion system protein VirB10
MANHDNEEEFDYDSSSLDTSAPDVASGKGSKVALIAVSAILIGSVLYFLFFNTNQDVSKVELQPVNTQQDFSSEAPAESVNLDELESIFGESAQSTEEEDIILEEPNIPSVPALPEIPKSDALDMLPTFLDLPEENIIEPSKEIVDISKNNGQQQSINDIVGNAPNSSKSNNSNNSNNQLDNIKTPGSIIVVSGGAGPANSVGYENNIINLNNDPINDLEKSEPDVTAQYIEDRTTMIMQGKIINSILETAINTEFPGDVRGVISRDVYAESGGNILIPKGSRVYGTYSSEVIRGQGRVSISWTRLIRPDGVVADVTIDASDQFGRAGIEGDVDNRYGSVITNSILTSILAVGGAIAAESLSGSDESTTTTDATTGTTTTTSSASSQAITDVTGTIVDTVADVISDTIDTEPVIRVPQGTRVTIIINSDIKLPAYNKEDD